MHLAFAHDGGADGDVELAFAVETEIAEAAGIRPARDGLKLVDDFHRPKLRRAGDTAAGKTISQCRKMRMLRAQPAFDSGNQMLHLRVFFQPHQFRHPHTAKLAHAPEIIAEQISDHHQLRALLLAGLQLIGQLRITLRIDAARACALDRPRLNMVAAEEQKPFRARGGNLEITRIQIRPKRCRTGRMQRPMEFPAPTGPRRREALGEIYLINVAGVDVVERAADSGGKLITGEV